MRHNMKHVQASIDLKAQELHPYTNALVSMPNRRISEENVFDP